ncbi:MULTISPECIES: GNAT family N-acetyltransferase [Streptomyces]|uniref:GNAT family N-acetyltransferase n=1 Tax=Streptomyces TaxID=1883 RepID=UPI00073DC69C|nr:MULTISPECIES: GNAT family N-acetyltransferase [unclassified Streptomyces]OYP18603.1 N-acetyltransferase [Streptomyces sp. FBKL.4005]BCM71298.1 putative acetyltransferase [Streptomyces sp. EAS-AB2608]CUW27327.1 Ribosomal-protein-serine acetyltransferase [Streptomyces reticuli]
MPYLTSPVVAPGALARRPQPTVPAGSGLLLRPWRAADAPAVHAAFQDPVLRQWHIRSCDSADEAAGWIAQWEQGWADEREAQWAVVDETTDELLGRVALRQILLGDGVAEVAYWTVARARGRGVAVRATAAVTHWAFEEIGFHRLELTHATANEASCRVAGKAGFALEGTKRSALNHQDGWHDMHLHARVRGD